jgi:hypothetical protein
VKRVIEKLRQRVREQRYTITTHANEEMSDDDLTASDIEQIILTGRIEKRLTRDPRGTRYEIVGQALDGRSVGVICRLLATGWLRIVTVYAVEEEGL